MWHHLIKTTTRPNEGPCCEWLSSHRFTKQVPDRRLLLLCNCSVWTHSQQHWATDALYCWYKINKQEGVGKSREADRNEEWCTDPADGAPLGPIQLRGWGVTNSETCSQPCSKLVPTWAEESARRRRETAACWNSNSPLSIFEANAKLIHPYLKTGTAINRVSVLFASLLRQGSALRQLARLHRDARTVGGSTRGAEGLKWALEFAAPCLHMHILFG